MPAGTDSEWIFSQYLDRSRLTYDRDYPVGSCNVDFRIHSTTGFVLADVKEVRDRQNPQTGVIEAHVQIRQDLNKFRAKFKGYAPTEPRVLVTVNCSNKFFTGFTVAQALIGAVGVTISSDNTGSALLHLPQGNASFTKTQNTTLSGVLVLVGISGPHYFFANPHATNPIDSAILPETIPVSLDRSNATGTIDLNAIMIWPEQQQAP